MYNDTVTYREFIVSRVEVARRKRAFATLCVSLLVGLMLALNKILFEYPTASTLGLIILSFLLVLANIWLHSFFKKFLNMKVRLTKTSVLRVNGQKTEDVLLKNITLIGIKKTTRGIPREIRIILSTNPDTYISGLDDFERFIRYLVTNSPKGTVVKERREHIEYDHPLFYVFFGIFCGITAVYVARFLLTLDATALELVFICFILYILAVVVYVVAKRPIASRYGKK